MIDFTILRMGLCQDIAAMILDLMRLIVMIPFQFAPTTGVDLTNLWMSRCRAFQEAIVDWMRTNLETKRLRRHRGPTPPEGDFTQQGLSST
jgi:hypothetical protein